jgi:hypothetical protein
MFLLLIQNELVALQNYTSIKLKSILFYRIKTHPLKNQSVWMEYHIMTSMLYKKDDLISCCKIRPYLTTSNVGLRTNNIHIKTTNI